MRQNAVRWAGVVLFALALGARATTLTWDADGVSGGTTGGTGTWNTASALWDNAGVMTTWNNATPDSAIFGGTAGTVTLGSAITAGTLTFNTAGYTIAKAGNNLTITSLAGSSALTVSGVGTFSITGSSAGYSGAITLGPSAAAATDLVSVGANDSLGTGTINMRGAVLQASAAGLTIANAINVGAGGFRVGGTNSFTMSGAITMDVASRTFANYSANGSTVTLSGGITTVSGATVAFDNASGGGTGAPIVVSGAITGAGAVTSSSAAKTTLTGNNTYAGNTTISGGTLSITGTGGIYRGGYFGSPVVAVSGGATLELENWQYNITSGSLGGAYGQFGTLFDRQRHGADGGPHGDVVRAQRDGQLRRRDPRSGHGRHVDH